MFRRNHVGLVVLAILFGLLLFSTPLFAVEMTRVWSAPQTNTDGSLLTDLGGYKLHYGISSGNYTNVIDLGNVTTYKVSGLTENVTYYFALTSYDIYGNESGYSNEVSEKFVVNEPVTYEMIRTWDAPTKNTDGSALTDLSGYKLYYGVSSGNYTNVIDVGNATSYKISGLSSNATYYFAVSAYDTFGNESAFSSEISEKIVGN